MSHEDFESMDIREIKDVLMRETAFRLYLAIKEADISELVQVADRIVKLMPKLKEDGAVLTDAERELMRRMSA